MRYHPVVRRIEEIDAVLIDGIRAHGEPLMTGQDIRQRALRGSRRLRPRNAAFVAFASPWGPRPMPYNPNCALRRKSPDAKANLRAAFVRRVFHTRRRSEPR